MKTNRESPCRLFEKKIRERYSAKQTETKVDREREREREGEKERQTDRLRHIERRRQR